MWINLVREMHNGGVTRRVRCRRFIAMTTCTYLFICKLNREISGLERKSFACDPFV